MSQGPILVTGAGGFIGGAVVDSLSRAGYAVRAGMRRAPLRADLAKRDGVVIVACDLDDADQLRAALTGASALVHCAYAETDRMVAQMGRLLTAADQAGVERVVLFSSIAVYGDRAGLIEESEAALGPLDPYGVAKQHCERLAEGWAARSHAGDSARRVIILRPGIVYGRGSPFWIDKLVARIKAGVWGRFGHRGEGLAALVHVDDVAEAVRLALECMMGPPAAGAPILALNIAGEDCPSWNGYFTALAEAMGAAPLRDIGSITLTRLSIQGFAAKLLLRAGLSRHSRLALAPTFGELRLFGRAATYSIVKAADTLGWRPAIDLRMGLKQSLGGKGHKL